MVSFVRVDEHIVPGSIDYSLPQTMLFVVLLCDSALSEFSAVNSAMVPSRLLKWESRQWRRVFGRRGGVATLARLSGILIRGVLGDRIWVRAGYMTYLSLLHLVPLGAVGLAISSRVGWENLLRAWLTRRLSPTAPDLADSLVAAMERLDLTALGYVGMAGILIAGLFALIQLEHDLDDVWVVRGHRPVWKSLLLVYPFAIVIAPILVALALASGVLAEAQSRIWIARLADLGAVGAWLYGWLVNLPVLFRLIPYVLTWFVLTAIYYLVPSGPVRLRSALIGGVVAGLIWQVVQGLYLYFQFAAATFREAWGYLAQIPLLLIWIFVSWLIFFLGAEIAFFWQHRHTFMPKWPIRAVPTEARERALIAIVREIVRSVSEYPDGMTTLTLSSRLIVPWRLVVRLVDDLTAIGALERRVFHRHVRYRPAPGLAGWTVSDLLSRWRRSGESLPEGVGELNEWPEGLTIGDSLDSGRAVGDQPNSSPA
jgi:membrane protein